VLAAAATPPQSCDLDLVCVDDDVDELRMRSVVKQCCLLQHSDEKNSFPRDDVRTLLRGFLTPHLTDRGFQYYLNENVTVISKNSIVLCSNMGGYRGFVSHFISLSTTLKMFL